MRHRHPFENRYCNGCQCTTRHEVKETTYACLRCGAVKYPTIRVTPTQKTPIAALSSAS